MKNSINLPSSLAGVMALSILFSPAALAGKQGFYGGLGVGGATIKYTAEDMVIQFVDGAKIDLVNYPDFVAQLLSTAGFTGPTYTAAQIPTIPKYIDMLTVDGTTYDNVTPDYEATEVIEDLLGSQAEQLTLFKKDPDKNSYVMRAFGGYNINRFFGVEFAAFITSTFSFESDSLPIKIDFVSKNDDMSMTPFIIKSIDTQLSFTNETTLRGLELIGTFSLPLDPFYVYAKAGIAYVTMKSQTKLKISSEITSTVHSSTDKSDITVKDDDDSSRFRPSLAVGLGYQITKDVLVDLSYQRYNFRNNKNSSSGSGLFHKEDLGNQPIISQFLLSVSVQLGIDKCGDLNC